MLKVVISKSVGKVLDRLSEREYLSVRKRIFDLENNPRPVGSLKLTDQEGYRIRVGNIRILYSIDDNNKLIKILKVGPRKDIYRQG
jgi:mRNA interferase RelE/StbE